MNNSGHEWSHSSPYDNDSWRAIEIGRQEQMARDLDSIAHGGYGPRRQPTTDELVRAAREEGRVAGRRELTTTEKHGRMVQSIIWIGSVCGMCAFVVVASVFNCWSNPVAVTLLYPLVTAVVMSVMFVFWPEPEPESHTVI